MGGEKNQTNQNRFTTQNCRKKTNWRSVNHGLALSISNIWFLFAWHVCGLVDMSPKVSLLCVTEPKEHWLPPRASVLMAGRETAHPVWFFTCCQCESEPYTRLLCTFAVVRKRVKYYPKSLSPWEPLFNFLQYQGLYASLILGAWCWCLALWFCFSLECW